jgi:hypothetical protein
MSRTSFVCVAALGLAAAGCGSATHFADRSRPPTPIDLTVYVNNARVSVSPASVGAGPVIFYVTNQAAQTETLTVQPAGGGRSLANTGPINPGETAQVQVDFSAANRDYTVTTNRAGASDAAQATGRPITPATLHVGAPRPSADNALLQP